MPVEKLTRERRRQQTRDVLIAAAAEVFAVRGFEGASLEEIADTAGFTRGAIYKNFSGKDELFFAVTEKFNEQVIETFRSIQPAGDSEGWDIATIAATWRESVAAVDDLFGIGMEFQLYALRNPAARERAAAHHARMRTLVAGFITEVAEQWGMTLRLPAETLASMIVATADGLTYASRVYGEDLFGPFLEVLNAGMVASP